MVTGNEGKAFGGNLTALSTSRLNASKIISDSGLEIDLLLPKYEGQIFVPKSDYNILKRGVPVFWFNDVYNVLGLKKHYHDSDNDDVGGEFAEMFIRNIGNTLCAFYNTYNKTIFFTNTSGTGAEVIDEISGSLAYVSLESGTDNNGYSNGRIFGVPMGFDKASAYQTRIEHEGNLTDYNIKFGINAEVINLTNNISQESYGNESCPADTKMLAWSCDGVSRTTDPTAFDHDQNIHVWTALHEPAQSQIRWIRDVDFTAQNILTKGDEVPISGKTEEHTLFGIGVKANAASAEKKLRFYGANIFGRYATNISWRWAYSSLP